MTISEYINLPELAGEPDALGEVHAIRLMIHDETKSMTAEERRGYHHNNRKEADAYFARPCGVPRRPPALPPI
jgi:hypothetical protein